MKIHRQGKLEYLVAENIPVSHCFTTRLGGVSTGYLDSLNLGMHRGDPPENVAENYKILANSLGFDLEKIILTHQVHSDTVRIVTEKDHLGFDHRQYPQCDALVTNTPGVVLTVFTADCTPILLCDPVTGAVGAIHAGWRGTAMDIAGKTVRTMEAVFGCEPQNIRAAIGPNIAQCCFETDGDVPAAMVQAFGSAAEKWIRPQNDKYYVNLKEINRLALNRAGVENVELSGDCTACQCHRYWSHRITGGQRGSQGALIQCKEREE